GPTCAGREGAARRTRRAGGLQRQRGGDAMPRVLVVDDDAHIRELVRHFLDLEGYEVHEAAGGEEALAVLETVRVDLVVLDLMTPGMDGWTLCRELRSHGDVPILMLTARGETTDKV